MNKLKTSEMTGAALDWAVAKAEGMEIDGPSVIICKVYRDDEGLEWVVQWEPTTNWAQGGPLIAQHIFLLEDLGDYEWGATAANGCKCRGDTVLQAVCRAYVLATLGEEVEIPNELEAPQPVKRQPLTDEEIDRVTDVQWASNNHKPIYAAHRAYARAAIAAYERKNGIGGQP